MMKPRRFARLLLLAPMTFLLAMPMAAGAPESSDEVSAEAREVVRKVVEVFQGFHPDNAKDGEFSVAACPRVSRKQWLALLLLNQPIRQSYKFGGGCDVEGAVVITREPFVLDLKVRNVAGVERVQVTISPEFSPRLRSQEILVTVRALKGKIFKASKELLQFFGEYNVTTHMNGKLKKNSGGVVRVREFRGTPVNVLERFKVGK